MKVKSTGEQNIAIFFVTPVLIDPKTSNVLLIAILKKTTKQATARNVRYQHTLCNEINRDVMIKYQVYFHRFDSSKRISKITIFHLFPEY